VVRDTDEGITPLAPIEIDFVKGHEFDFSARYTAEFVGLRALDLDPAVVEEVGQAAVRAHEVLGLRDVSRSDFIVEDDGTFVVLETAITPGTTETSVFPFACTASGTTLGAVAKDLVARALRR
jgi:D-alanine-D-alanine ligase